MPMKRSLENYIIMVALILKSSSETFQGPNQGPNFSKSTVVLILWPTSFLYFQFNIYFYKPEYDTIAK